MSFESNVVSSLDINSIHGDFANKLEELWEDLKQGITKIYVDGHSITREEYMAYYTNVYDFCADVKGKRFPNVGNKPKMLMCMKLKSFFSKYLNEVLAKADNLMDEQLLQFYVHSWLNFRMRSRVLNGIFQHFNKYWAPDVAENDLDRSEVYNLALRFWEELFLVPIKWRISTAVLKLIKKERCGEVINSQLVTTSLNSYIELDNSKLTTTNGSNNTLKLYQDLFEQPFLHETRCFYLYESSALMRKNPFTEFMKKVDMWLMEEKKRVQLYFHDTTLKPLIAIVEAVAINNYLDTFHLEFRNLLNDDKMEDLGRMYRLVSRITNGLDRMRVIFEEHVCQHGQVEIEKNCDHRNPDPKVYINTVMSIYRHSNGIVIEAFENEPGFCSALDRGCGVFINKNALTESSGMSGKSAEMLAKYCDLLLRKKLPGSEDFELNETLNELLIGFKYIEDKDVFQNYYCKLMAKRLLQACSSDDAETMLITKLRELCGYEYISKLQRLFQDVCISRDLNNQFKDNCAGLINLDFNINVISSSCWPFSQTFPFTLPRELENSIHEFAKFYYQRHGGRKLQWLHNMSRGELKSRCYDKPYTFQASTFQFAVLLQFNSVDEITTKQLHESTDMRQDIFMQVLQGLVKQRLLKINTEVVEETSIIKPNDEYKNKKLKININMPIKSEVKAEQETVQRHVGEDRKMVIQAAIVRIAKARKTVHHNQLMTEILDQISQKFKPKIFMIRRCIEILIEKEYLMRDANDMYAYLA